jgi:pimeloyl-ACP methyl ester carboxylesterase
MMFKAFLLLVGGGILSTVAEARLTTPTGIQPNPDGPLLIMVHGVNPETGFFNPLAEALAAQLGYRILYFEYDGGKRLDESADLLVDDVDALRRSDPKGDLTVIAHSMGGLVARRAMTEGRAKTLADGRRTIRLLTIATPFGGYKSANPTRLKIVRILFRAFGVTEAQQDIASKSDFIQKPGKLGKGVTHAKIETYEEKETRIDPRGKRVKDTVVHCKQQVLPSVDDEVNDFETIFNGHMAVLNDGGQISYTPLVAIERWLEGKRLADVEYRCTEYKPVH